MAEQSKKLKLLYILELLENESDEAHPVSLEDILRYLRARGITAERKSIYKDIAVLTAYGYDILKKGGSTSGWFLGVRQFELAEIRLLCDAVQAATFISPKKTSRLLEKICTLVSRSQAETIRHQIYVENRLKSANEGLYYTIDKLHTAIQNAAKVSVLYRRRIIAQENTMAFSEKEHIVSPYALIWSNDHYYLVGNNANYDNLMIMRIDRIKHVQILENERGRPLSEVSAYKTGFDSADYVNKHFYMFSGEPKPIELICKNELIENILDKFGENANIRKHGQNNFLLKADVAVSGGLVSWIMQFGDAICVKSPLELRNMILDKAEQIRAVYTMM